ncbi:MAG: CpsD/CapB family tyrosine-protein kinase [Clostridia bacterium]|nr:CpsD/CapB family tyrosine-protein kinase [Clostridia bacterium]
MAFKKNKDLELKNGIVYNKVGETQTDGYDRLKDNLLYLNADGKNKVIQMVSSISGEGKTTVCANLAVGLGLTEKKVVVVDLDFKSQGLNEVFNISAEKGVAEYILGQVEYENLPIKTEYENVFVITGGSNIYNSSLILVSEKFKALFEKLRSDYDYVIIDSAPVLNSSDFIHLIKVADGVLFLARHGKTTRNQIAESVKELTKNGANILGSVFTRYNGKNN